MGIFAWPDAVIVISVTAMIIFWKPLSSFLYRANKIGTTGIEATTGAQDTSKSEVGPSIANDARQSDDPILVEREKSFCTELGLGADPTPKEKNLLGSLAAHSIALQFEKIYQAIYGSQLHALGIINTAPGGVQFGAIEHIYNQTAAQDKERYADYSFEQWLTYIERESLSIKNGRQDLHHPRRESVLEVHDSPRLYAVQTRVEVS